MPITPTTFSAQLQKLRKDRKVTQEQLAAHLGVSSQAVSKWENGSYPDGDLLPKIADFFDVSIDYLYGRADRDVPVTQQIINELQAIERESDENDNEKFFDKILEYSWAIQIAGWQEMKQYFPRNKHEKSETVSVSTITDKKGFSFFRLNEDLEYYFIVKTPPQGFAHRLGKPEELAPLFEFLGDIINLKVLMYMLSLDSGMVIKASTVAERLNIPTERAKKALDILCKIGGKNSRIFHDGNIISYNSSEKKDVFEKVYDTSVYGGNIIVMLLAAADMAVNQPVNYELQIGKNDKAWFDREQLEFLKSRGNYEKEKQENR